MSSIIRYLANKFASKQVENKQYIDIKPLIQAYKSIRGNSKTTFKSFIEKNNLEYLVIKRNDDDPIDISLSKYEHRSHNILISAESITKIENFMQRLENNYAQELKALEEIIEPTNIDSQDSTEEESIDTEEQSNFDILELTDEEKFRDTKDNIHDIEVRGTRSENGILFRASDIAKYLGMENLIKTLNDTRREYEKNIHWIRLLKYSDKVMTSSQLRHCHLLQEVEKTIEKPIWKRTYLTLNGLLKVIFTSKSANENVIQLRNWVIHLVFTHQFGSVEERENLSIELNNYKSNLNDIPGIYCIRIGKVKELRESMNISKELYPAKDFDSSYVIKFGRAEDIMSRFAQHSARTGYGKYGKITLDWFVMIPKTFLPRAESNLHQFFKASGMMFEYNDGHKDHNELIIVKPGEERKQLKDKYKELVGNFPSTINELSKQLTTMRADFEQKLETVELKADKKVMSIQSEYDRKLFDMEKQLFGMEKQLMEANHKNEILELKLEYASK